MKMNMGAVDRALRVALALTVGVLWYMNVIGGVLAIVLAVLAAVFLLTSFFGFCPLYRPFGFSTRGKGQ
ncbi:MAG: DUF2892 domain-containing protein [Hyphomonadaceae bacterium]|nr:DUF2892 domain-containing protein [Hyphomonadaceae bacterium]